MARRPKKSHAEEWIDLLSLLPWGSLLLIGLAGGGILHAIAASALPSVAGRPDAMGSLMNAVYLHGIATAGQYLVPILCAIAALVSFWKRRRRSARFGEAATSAGRTILDRFTGSEFERRVLPTTNGPSCPKCRSPMVRRTAPRGADAGIAFWGCPSFPACRGTRPFESA